MSNVHFSDRHRAHFDTRPPWDSRRRPLDLAGPRQYCYPPKPNNHAVAGHSYDAAVRRATTSRWDDIRRLNEGTRPYQAGIYSSDNENVDFGYHSYNYVQPNNPRASDTRDHEDAEVTSPSKPARFSVDPTDPQDITVHMSLPVQDDLEDLLEECCRLRRVGNFRKALGIFEEKLKHFLDNRYVLLQYGHCLLEAGQYTRLETVAKGLWPQRSEPEDLLQLAWDMLLDTANLGGREIDERLGAARELLRKRWPIFDSTEAQMLARVIGSSRSELQLRDLGNWNHLYRHLIDQGMIWEFRDVLEELTVCYGVDTAMSFIGVRHAHTATETKSISGQDHTSTFEQLCLDWEKGAQDDSTSFALLDILTTLALKTNQSTSSSRANSTKRCLRLADKYASKLVAKNPDSPVSRPYLRYAMAQILVKSPDHERFNDSMMFKGLSRGILLFPLAVFPYATPPIYLLVDEETPRWEPDPTPQKENRDIEAIRTILQAAEETGDLDMQAGCLQEFLYRGGEPVEKTIDRIVKLWSSAGKVRELQIMHMFRYLFAHTKLAREQLRQDILLDLDGELKGHHREAQCMILRALASTEREKNHYWTQAQEARQFLSKSQYDRDLSESDKQHKDKDRISGRVSHQHHFTTERRLLKAAPSSYHTAGSIDNRLEAIRRYVGIQQAKRQGDGRKVEGLHFALEELGVEKHKLQQQRMIIKPERGNVQRRPLSYALVARPSTGDKQRAGLTRETPGQQPVKTQKDSYGPTRRMIEVLNTSRNTHREETDVEDEKPSDRKEKPVIGHELNNEGKVKDQKENVRLDPVKEGEVEGARELEMEKELPEGRAPSAKENEVASKRGVEIVEGEEDFTDLEEQNAPE